MSYYAGWLIENHIVYIYLDGKLRDGEMASLNNELNQLANSASETRIHLLMEDGTFEGINKLAESRLISVPTNIDIILSCNQNAIQQFMGKIIAQLSGKNMRFITSLNEGLTKLARMEGRTAEEVEMWQHRLIDLQHQARLSVDANDTI